MNEYIGRYARSIESGWLGKVVGVDIEHNGIPLGMTMLRMQGVNELVRDIKGGDIEDCLDSDDTQWFTPEDVRFLTLVQP